MQYLIVGRMGYCEAVTLNIWELVLITESHIENLHKQFWKPGFGSISVEEAMFLYSGIADRKPNRFLEIGTASGLSTGLIALFLDQTNPKNSAEITTIDFETTFWVDRTKETGYLANEIYQGNRVSINTIRGRNSLFIDERLNRKPYDMAFIDANHQHPWPTLDMIALVPAMATGGLVYHHDLALYKLKNHSHGIGPKYLYDQIPSNYTYVMTRGKRNMFYLNLPEQYSLIEQPLIDSLYLPWSNVKSIDEKTIQGYASLAKKYWSLGLRDAILETAQRFNGNKFGI